MLAKSTSSRPWKMSLVPLPWWTSQSSTRTRSRAALERVLRRDRDVVEEAEAHRGRRARRGGPAGACRRSRTGRSRRAARRPSRTPRRRRAARRGRSPALRIVSASRYPPPASAAARIASTYALRVDRGHRRALGLGRLAPLEPEPAARLELRLDRRNPRLVLGMRAGVVLERARVVEVERRTDPGTVIRP